MIQFVNRTCPGSFRRRTIAILIVILSFGLGFWDSAGGAQSAFPADLVAEVRDAVSGAPISGARLTIEALGLQATTDAEGRLALRGIALPEAFFPITVVVRATGYGDWTMIDIPLLAEDELRLTIDLGSQPQSRQIPLEPLERDFSPPSPDRPGLPEGPFAITGPSSLVLPDTIRVRVTGKLHCLDSLGSPYTVQTIPFKDYVRNVIPNEWPVSWPREAYRAGAMAVKMYAWYWIAAGGKWNDADVYDSTCDQVYIPGASYGSTDRAVDFTWNWRMSRDNGLISIHYLDTQQRCTDYRQLYGPEWDDCMGQWSTYYHALGNNGYAKLTWDEMLAMYYDDTTLNYTQPLPPGGWALRFYGNGYQYPDQDRIKIPLTTNKSIDVGANFTLEFWIKAALEDNNTTCAGPEQWNYGNMMLDRDVGGTYGDYGDYRLSLCNGRVAFGVHNTSSGAGLMGTQLVADNTWHHIAVTRRSSDGRLQLYVDGALDAQVTGPTGDLSYRDGRSTSFSNDRFLVLGAEKHDTGAQYPSYNGYLDELRISNSVRYDGNFSRPEAAFNADGNTVALYHFNTGYGNTAFDATGANNGQRNYGGDTNGPEWFVTDLFLTPRVFIPMIIR